MARLDVVEVVVEHPDATRPPARAVAVENRKYVHRAADETEVLFYTATDAHAPVARVLDDDDLTGVALHSQVLGLTERVLEQSRRSTWTFRHHTDAHTHS